MTCIRHSSADHVTPPAAAQRPARLRGGRPLRQLHARGAGAVRHPGRGEPARRRRWKAGSRCSCFERAPPRHRAHAAGAGATSRAVARGARPDRRTRTRQLQAKPRRALPAHQAAADLRDPLAGAAARALPCAASARSTCRSPPRTSAPTSIARRSTSSIHSEPEPAGRPGLSAAVRRDAAARLRAGLLARGPPLAQPADLAQHVLLCSMNRPNDWPAWLAAARRAAASTATAASSSRTRRWPTRRRPTGSA